MIEDEAVIVEAIAEMASFRESNDFEEFYGQCHAIIQILRRIGYLSEKKTGLLESALELFMRRRRET
jgi:hypothetical protein